MGKKNKASQSGGPSLGRALIKDRFSSNRGKKMVSDNSMLHTTELEDGYDWGRLNLQSVTEESSFQEFLSTAELAGTEFQAEKLNIRFVNPLSNVGLLSKDELKKANDAHTKFKDLLKIPRRPPWSSDMSTSELDRNEKDSFLEWRRSLARLQEDESVLLTPYEKNLEFWRQLWRVVERSDVVVQIVDARNPSLFRCEDLEKYVNEVSNDKINLILINKADFLTDIQRQNWANYFASVNLRAVFFSATAEADLSIVENDEKVDSSSDSEDSSKDINYRMAVQLEIQANIARISKNVDEIEVEVNKLLSEAREHFRKKNLAKGKAESNHSAKPESKNSAQPKSYNSAQPESNISSKPESNNLAKPESNNSAKPESNNLAKPESNNSAKPESNNLAKPESNNSAKPESNNLAKPESNNSAKPESNNSAKPESNNSAKPESNNSAKPESNNSAKPESNNSAKLLTREELVELFRTIHTGPKVTENITTIGLVGYPNVGKSSTINALLAAKKVSVSATPGKTKHFQTLFLDKDILLCDCPGLVMPSFVFTKAEMILNGILPVDQMRDHIPPVNLLSNLIPKYVIEDKYGIMLPLPLEGEDPDRAPTAEELLNAYAYNRGFMTANGQPDNARAARYVLKDYINGKLLYCHAPPDLEQTTFHKWPERQREASENRILPPREVRAIRTLKVTTDDIDKMFFNGQKQGAHSKGITGKSTGIPGVPSDETSSEVLAKPWKNLNKHRNKNKKEKLRRVYAHLDQH